MRTGLDKEALPLVAVEAALAIALGFWSLWAVAAVGMLLVFTVAFFRDPERSVPVAAGAILSAADGKIITAGPDKVSIFMNVFDVHVCRAPISGRVLSVRHTRGRFLAAFKDRASDQNERTEIVLESGSMRVQFTLVAGLVARRIVCRVEEGQLLEAGQRVGLIRFGSRVDVGLPPRARVAVSLGERVVAGETVLARLAGTGPPGAP